jgi:hypothetical protein
MSLKESIKFIQQALKLTEKQVDSATKLSKAEEKRQKNIKAFQSAIAAISKEEEKQSKQKQDQTKQLEKQQKLKMQELKLQTAISAFNKMAGGSLAGVMKGIGTMPTQALGVLAQSEKFQKSHPKMARAAKVGSMLGGSIIEAVVDAILFQTQIGMRQSVMNTRLSARTGRNDKISINQPNLTFEEAEKYSQSTVGLGITSTSSAGLLKEIQEFAANSKLYGDELAKNVTDRMINSSGTIEKSWEHINRLSAIFKNQAKDAGIPLDYLLDQSSAISEKLRFINVDEKIVVSTLTTAVKLYKERGVLQQLGVTRSQLGAATENMLSMRSRMDPAMKLFYAQMAGMKGTPGEQFDMMTYGGPLKWSKTSAGTLESGQNLSGDEATLSTLRVAKELLEKVAPENRGMYAELLRKSGIINLDEAGMKLLFSTPIDQLKNAENENAKKLIQANLSNRNLLGKLADFEGVKQKLMFAVTGLLLSIIQNLFMIPRQIGLYITGGRKGWKIAEEMDRQGQARTRGYIKAAASTVGGAFSVLDPSHAQRLAEEKLGFSADEPIAAESDRSPRGRMRPSRGQGRGPRGRGQEQTSIDNPNTIHVVNNFYGGVIGESGVLRGIEDAIAKSRDGIG